MRVAFVGCGYVFDIYMRTRWAHPELEICGVFDLDVNRMEAVRNHYGISAYDSYDALLADPAVEIVVNLTNIRAHYEVSRRALEAGKHVYSEKPMTTAIEETQEIFALAKAKNLVLSGAPCNLYSDSVSTLWKAVRDGAIGKPLLVYAELDSNPGHLMQFERVRSPSGAPWPYVEEFQEGCTFEHVGYHLVWICALFGPAISVTAFSKALIKPKTDTPLSPDDTPDYSVACLDFENGVAARVTCSIVAPRDHRLRVIGEKGEISVDDYALYRSPVRLERFSRVSLTARKARSLRLHALLGCWFGIGGRRLTLIRRWKSHAVEAERGVRRSFKQRLVSWIRRREVYAQDKLLGVAEMVRALRENRPQPLTPEFLMHINELTLMIQRAGPTGLVRKPSTTFQPIDPLPDVSNNHVDYRASYRLHLFEKLFGSTVETFHTR
jgi:predicted dehydrogenase